MSVMSDTSSMDSYERDSVRSRYDRDEDFFWEEDAVDRQQEGFFVSQSEVRDRQRERQRAFNRLRQRAYAEELSRQATSEFLEEHLQHLLTTEEPTMAEVVQIEQQPEIKWYMRPYLLDFLIEAHAAFQLLPETFFLAVNILDRYCSRRTVYKRHYQLVGCAALLIASKYGDKKEHVPTKDDLVGMCCSLYDSHMFIQMEWHMLATIDWNVGHTTCETFKQVALVGASFDPEVDHMTTYICELASFHKEFISVRPSVLARAALALSRCILARRQCPRGTWAGNYDPMVVCMLSEKLATPSAVLKKKYSSMHLSDVSTTLEMFLYRQAQIATSWAPPAAKLTYESQPAAVSGGMPMTPEKINAFSAPVPRGVLTPPETPDCEMFGTQNYGVNGGMMPQYYPSTPTPQSAGLGQPTRQFSEQQYLAPEQPMIH